MISSACGSQFAATAAKASISSAENGKYKMWCFDSISEGAWFLRGGNKIILRHDPKTADGEIIAVAGFERYFDQTFLYIRYQEGRREEGMKQWVKPRPIGIDTGAFATTPCHVLSVSC